MNATNELGILHPRVVDALFALSDTSRTVRVPLLKGQAAGQLQLINSQWPPEGFCRDAVPARFTLDFDIAGMAIFELHLKVELVYREECRDDFVLGLINNDQWQMIHGVLPSLKGKLDFQERHERWVVIKYSSTRREGWAFLSRNIHGLLLELALP